MPQTQPATLATTTSAPQSGLVVAECQRGNPVLAELRRVRWYHGSTAGADYVVAPHGAVLFLSLRYHRLHPEYLRTRVHALAAHYELRILLVLVDVDDPRTSVAELGRTCLAHHLTLVVAATWAECARYVEAYCALASRDIETSTPVSNPQADSECPVSALVGEIHSVNRTDVRTLLSNFGSIAQLVEASVDELASCPGIGKKKAVRIYSAFRKPFKAEDGEEEEEEEVDAEEFEELP